MIQGPYGHYAKLRYSSKRLERWRPLVSPVKTNTVPVKMSKRGTQYMYMAILSRLNCLATRSLPRPRDFCFLSLCHNCKIY